MQEVYFIKSNFLEKLGKALKKFDLKAWAGKTVAVKIHMGEYGNLNYTRPPIAGKVVEVLQKAGAKPFLFDSTTKYKGSRFTVEAYYDTARRNGFTEETIGCPIVITDNSVKEKGFLDREIGVSKEVAEADRLLALSHCKGHMFAGFGGAVKNLGFGAVDAKTKGVFHLHKSKLLEHTANQCAAVLKKFRAEEMLFVNVLNDFSKFCDCHNDAPFGIMKGIGIIASQSITAIDRASMDIVNREFGRNIFNHLGYIDPSPQVDLLAEHGFGNTDYKLVEI